MSDGELTLERLFDAPPLSGPVAGQVRYAPDGGRVAYLRPGADDPERYDLWLHDVEGGEARCIADARSLAEDRALSEEERARRERARVFAHGIVEFFWSPDGDALVFPLAGRLHRLRVAGVEAVAPPAPLTPASLFVTDARPAPRGEAIAFVAERDLWVLDSSVDAEPRRLTREGGETVSAGLADFIAAEEMHRFEGYWWSPDAARIAFTRVDTAPIPPSWRCEFGADRVEVHAERYPYAGGPNARVELEVLELADGSRRPVAWARDEQDYLARVSWFPDARRLAVQRQSRDQRTLELAIHDTATGDARTLLTETSRTWVNLHDNLRFLGPDADDPQQALWTSERDGTSRLYRVGLESGEATALTPAGAVVDSLIGVDEALGMAYVEGWLERPVERHLYAVGLDGTSAPRRLTPAGGWHRTTLAPDHRSFVDRATTLDQPPSLWVRTIDDPDAAPRATALIDNRLDHGHPYRPYLDDHAPSELGTIAAEDGQTLWYRLTRPSGFDPERRYPALVCVYGGPGVQRVQHAWPPLAQQYFARRGWIVFELDNRGSANRGRAFEAPIHGRLGHPEVDDQAAGAAWLGAQRWVDPERIAVYGHSYGGYMALMCLARRPETFRAGIAVAPVTDWRLYDTHYTERYLGHPADAPQAYESSAVIPHLGGLAGRLLLIHGMADDNVMFTHCTRVMKALQDRGVEFELMTYPDAKHGLAGRSVSLHRFRLMTDFLRRTLGEPS